MIKLRRVAKAKPCYACGSELHGKYSGEVAVELTITLCLDCAYALKDRLFRLPSSVELKRQALTNEPLSLPLLKEEK